MDAGCRHSGSLQIDGEKSFRSLRSFFENNNLKKEEKWLADNKIDLVISDVASTPLKAASELKLPSILVGNFTWHDIYSRLPEAKNNPGLIRSLAEEYSKAAWQILPQCHLSNEIIKNKKEVGFIANKGKNVRNEIEHFLGRKAKNKTLVFIYLGENGARSVDWKNLKKNKGCLFITRDPVPHSSDSLRVFKGGFSYHDLTASSDIILTKGGYSTLATAFASNKPVITCERNDFFEFEAVREYLLNREIGIVLKDKEFQHGDWREPIKRALKLTVKNKVPLNGETEIADIVRETLS